MTDLGVGFDENAGAAMPELAMPELAMPELAMPELAMPGPAMPGLAVPGLAAPAPWAADRVDARWGGVADGSWSAELWTAVGWTGGALRVDEGDLAPDAAGVGLLEPSPAPYAARADRTALWPQRPLRFGPPPAGGVARAAAVGPAAEAAPIALEADAHARSVFHGARLGDWAGDRPLWREAPRRMGPPPPGAEAERLRRVLRARPRIRRLSGLSIGALLDAFATEAEAESSAGRRAALGERGDSTPSGARTLRGRVAAR